MASCELCGSSAVIDNPLRCEEHFLLGFEQKIKDTIAEFDLITPGMRIAVAVSGGKDSLVVLTLLKRWHEDVTAIAIDEGIAGYREHTLEDARRVCEEHGIPLVIKSFEELAGKTLDQMIAQNGKHPCTVCGALRRHLLAVASREFDVLATGHNADDETQAVLMNIIKGNTEVFPRLGPASGVDRPGFTRRVKPLYFCTEREVMAYAHLKGLSRGFNECPHVAQSYRHIIRDELNWYAQRHPGVRERLLRRFLMVKATIPPSEMGDVLPCRSCGMPSSSGECKACAILVDIRR